MQIQETTAHKSESSMPNYRYEILMAEYAAILENTRHYEQSQQQFLVVIGAFLALAATADKIFAIDIASLWYFFPIASIFVSAVSMFFIQSLLAVSRSGLFIRIHILPNIKRLCAKGDSEIEKVVIWEQFVNDFDKRLPLFPYSGLPQILLAILPNASILYLYVKYRPSSGFTFIDLLAIITLLVFIQVILTGGLAAKISTISSEEDWNQVGSFRLRKKAKTKIGKSA